MKKAIITAATLLFVSTPFTSHAYDIKKYCKAVSDAVGGSYQIEESCRQMEQQSKSNVARMNVPSRIKSYCDEVSRAVGGSYQIYESCIKMELEAKSRMD